MEPDRRASLRGLHVVSFESRRATEMAELIRRYGGEPVIAPSLREIPLSDNPVALQLVAQIETGAFDVLVLTTGIGTKTLNDVLRTSYSQERINAALARVKIVARGPKPVAVLRELGLQPALTVPEPNTWREIVQSIEGRFALSGKRIALQEYGVTNQELIAALGGRGATVISIPVYRWVLPEDTAPLREAIHRIARGEIDVALFTNGAQVEHLFKVALDERADASVRDGLQKIIIGSVGP